VKQRTREEVIADLVAPGQRFEISLLDVGGVTMKAYRNAPATLRDVLVESTRFRDQEFLVYDDTRWTYGQHLDLVGEFAGYLATSLGIGKGDRVGIAMRNYPEWSVAFWACQALGAVAVPLNAWWSAEELTFAIRDSGSLVLVVDEERLTRLEPSLDGLDVRRVVVVRDQRTTLPPGVSRWSDVCTGRHGVNLPTVLLGPDDLSTIVYTSGTTGTPKGAMHVHRNHCTSVMSNLFSTQVDLEMRQQSADLTTGTPAQAASLLTFPLFHIAGLVNLYLPMSMGSKVVLLYRWDVDRAVQLIIDERVTSTVVVPTVLRELLDSERLQSAGGACLMALAAGGAMVPAALIRRIGDDFDNRVTPVNGYGLTETTAGVVSTSGADYLAHPDSIGRPFQVVDVRVVDSDGRTGGVDEVGEVWVRGPNVVRGYWNNPRATSESFTDGWFHTGDLGRQDADGRFYIVDRLKDVVIRGGENVYCAEVEAALVDYPGLAEVAVIGLPDERLGEQVVAVVRWDDEDNLEVREGELVQFAREHLAYFKVPTRIVEWPTELPRNASGKVMKRELRVQIEHDGASVTPP
jgi:long-chain acyl-CoA synthetase